MAAWAALGAAAPADQGADRELARRLERALAATRFQVGVVARSLEDGRLLFARQPDRLFSVASNMKLVTAAAALALLGPDYAWRTAVLGRGRLEPGGRWAGELILRGGGDPTISGRDHGGDPLAVPREWARAVRQRGILAVDGGIVLDDAFFDRELVHPGWPADQLASWYCAPVSALAFNDDCLDVTVEAGARPGELARCSFSPPATIFSVDNQLRTVAGGAHRVIVDRPFGGGRIVLRGAFRAGEPPSTTSVTVPDPALFLGDGFRVALAGEGVRLAGEMARRPGAGADPGLVLLAETASPLAPSLTVLLKRSQNFYAEQIFKTLGREVEGEGSFAGGARAVARYLAGVAPPGMELADGSGLARGNRFSPRQIVAVLVDQAAQGEARWALFRDALPISGVDGTLDDRLREPGRRGRVRAKTGYINGVSALSGYLETERRGWLVFSILVEARAANSEMKALQDRLCRELLAWGAGGGPG